MRGFVQTRSCLLIAVLALPLAAGCSMGWTQGWKLDAATPLKGTPDVEALRLAARAADGAAVDLKGVESLVRAWKDVLRAVPEDYEALWNLSSAYTLMGAGYSRSVGEKGEMYRKALQNAERAMALDEGFRKEIDAGAETWDAITVLPAARADAVGWWATAMMRMYNECLSGVVQETRKVWIDRDRKVLAHLQTLAPSWNGSLATYDTAVTAAVMPKRAGGDLAKAAAELARASGCALLGVTVVRQAGGYAAQILPEFHYDRSALGNREARRELTQTILRGFEPAIRQHPDQWFHFVPLWPEAEPPEPRPNPLA